MPVSLWTMETSLPVGVTVTSAQWAVSSMSVQLCVAAQQPPFRLSAQEIWPAVQPGGTMVACAELVGGGVVMHPPAAHVYPKEQQPLSKGAGQRNWEGLVQRREQHESTRDVVAVPPAVIVAVLLHWYCSCLHGEPHVEPIWQHAGLLVSFGLMMQLLREGLITALRGRIVSWLYTQMYILLSVRAASVDTSGPDFRA